MAIQRAYRLLFNSALPRGEAIARVGDESGHIPEIVQLLDFLGESERGVMV
jgi:acyl-[acyl carrier protein]--UDP-N-acetylglucosamine O-acyltransferase